MRAEVLDAKGNVVHGSDINIAFTVKDGPGILHSTANGNPSDHVPIHSKERRAYDGLARAVVRSAIDASGSNDERELRKLINSDAGRGERSAAILAGSSSYLGTVAVPVVVEACAEGLSCAQLSIPTSADVHDSPLEAALRIVGLADIYS